MGSIQQTAAGSLGLRLRGGLRRARHCAAVGLVLSLAIVAPLMAQDGRPALKIAPVVSYDPNMNGGMPGSSFVLGGLPFTLPPGNVAQQGVLIGAGLFLTGQTDVSANFGLEYSTQAQSLHNLASDLRVRSAGVSVCGLTFLSETTLGSICAATSREEKALSRSSTASFTFSADHRLPIDPAGTKLPGWDASLVGLMGRDKIDGGWRNKAGGSVGIYGPEGRSLTLGLTLFTPVKNALSDRYSLELALKTPDTFPAGLSLSFVRAEGGNFFGLSREDSSARLGVDVKLGRRMLASLGYSRKNSSIDFFDDTGTADIRFSVLQR